jgi:dTDP-4-dehydrorhamnose reductase
LRILLTGRHGQIGWDLERGLPALGEMVTTDRSTLDLADPDAIRRVVRQTKPDLIVNAAAYTAVDQAEREQALAFRINRDAAAILADEALQLDALLVHFSTDYAFDGDKRAPYVETDKANSVNAYGRSKYAGELAIQDSGCWHLIFRISWVYSTNGINFMQTILRFTREGKQIRVLNDQHGAPTTARMIAEAVPMALSSTCRDRSLIGLSHVG